MAYWLVKSEPDAFSWAQQVLNRVEPWTGVRNHMAKNNLKAMQKGDLPPIPAGPQSGSKPVISHLIPPALSPGMDKLIANLEIRPPQADDAPPTDIQLAAAKQLARDLAEARIIEEKVCDKILDGLTQKPPAK